jgi:two-component system, chemotaxis family, chemotaxis protein CheY
MSKRILLVEDDNCLRESLTLILENSGFVVAGYPDGRSAIKSLQHTQFDAIILDDNLPFIQGQDLLGLIRIQNPSVQVILMSGLFKPEDIQKIREKGANYILEKPFDPETILRCLSHCE